MSEMETEQSSVDQPSGEELSAASASSVQNTAGSLY